MKDFQCEWRIQIRAETEIEAAEKAAAAFADAIKTNDHNIWTVIDDDGDELEIPMVGTKYEDEEPDDPRFCADVDENAETRP